MTGKTTVISPPFSTPYITIGEYRQAPTGVDTTNLVKGNPSATEAELANQIARASSWIDTHCGQILSATTDTENQRARIDRTGSLHIFPRYSPIISISSFSYGSATTNLSTLSDLSIAYIEPREFEIPLTAGVVTSAGPLQFGSPRPGGQVYCQYTYVNGFPNTTLTATATAGATNIQVADVTGVLAGITKLGIYDGGQTEVVQVASSWNGVSTTLPLTAGLQFVHSQLGVNVSALPPAVKQAAILLTSTLIQTRGAVAVIAPSMRMQSSSYTQTGAGSHMIDEAVAIALELIEPFKRVR